MAYTPFPTFGGPEGSGGITAVQMPASRISFPTPNFNPRQREPEPTAVETIAPFMPLVTEGIMGLFKDEPEQQTRGEYLQSIAVNPQEPTELEEARADAYSFLGAPQEADGFGLDEIANLAVASQMGRGADDYGRTYAAIRKAREDARRTTESNRASFIQKQIDPPNYQYLNVQDSNKARQGIVDIRPAKFNPNTGEVLVRAPEHPDADEDGFIVADENWIDPSKLATADVTGVDVFDNPYFTELNETVQSHSEKEVAMSGAIEIAYATMEDLKRTEALAPETQGTTAVSHMMNFANNVRENFSQAFNLINRTGFSQNDTGGSLERQGTGFAAERLWNTISNPEATNQEINAATAAFEESQNLSLREVLGETAYNNVALRANFLQLAYLAAAANGQTGRTLSDRDLAYHLDIVGIGRTQDPEVLGRNLRRFINQTVRKIDTELQSSIPPYGLSRYPMEDPSFQSTVGMFYVPGTIENEEGDLVHDWKNYGEYTYQPFWDRYSFIENISNWQNKYGDLAPNAAEEEDVLTDQQQNTIRGNNRLDVVRGLTN